MDQDLKPLPPSPKFDDISHELLAEHEISLGGRKVRHYIFDDREMIYIDDVSFKGTWEEAQSEAIRIWKEKGNKWP